MDAGEIVPSNHALIWSATCSRASSSALAAIPTNDSRSSSSSSNRLAYATWEVATTVVTRDGVSEVAAGAVTVAAAAMIGTVTVAVMRIGAGIGGATVTAIVTVIETVMMTVRVASTSTRASTSARANTSTRTSIATSARLRCLYDNTKCLQARVPSTEHDTIRQFGHVRCHMLQYIYSTKICLHRWSHQHDGQTINSIKLCISLVRTITATSL